MNIDPVKFTSAYLEKMEPFLKQNSESGEQTPKDTFAWYDPASKSAPARPPSLKEFQNDIAAIEKMESNERILKQYLGMSLLVSAVTSSQAIPSPMGAPLYLTIAATVGKELIPASMDKEITAQSANQLIGSQGISKSPELNEQANRVASALLEHSPLKGEKPEIIVLDSDNINAHALPGRIFVTKGLMETFPTDGELALFLGHEMAHAQDRDYTESSGLSMFDELAVSHTLMKSKVHLDGSLFNIGDYRKIIKDEAPIASINFEKNNEFSADYNGTKLMLKAGYAFEDAISALEKICDIDYSMQKSKVKSAVITELGYLDDAEVERRMVAKQKFDDHPTKEERLSAAHKAFQETQNL